MPGAYQIKSVVRTDPHAIRVTVDFTDTARPGVTITQTFTFDGDPPGAALDTMLQATRVLAFRSSVLASPAIVAGAAVPIAIDPVVP